ncbi:MAG: LysM peptidoglycan-binding domain-containing protein [Halofilum sp. (in: g-proteobacteria)]|nr:LysM peptidoglycan-binding domain-containing protein [Halofilum sp. (in: g-proteobacteria)]
MPFLPEPLRGYEPGPWAQVRAGFELPAIGNPRVARELQRYAGRQAYFEALTRRAEPYLDYILGRIEARGLPTELLLVPVVESAFRPFAYSYASAGGLWQFKPATARHFGLEMNWWYDGRRDIVAGTEAALDYFEYLHGFFDGDWLLAIAAYNAGEGTVRRAVNRNRLRQEPTDFWHLDLPAQTERYVPRVLALRAIVADPGAHGIDLPRPDPARAMTLVELDAQIDLATAAGWAGVDIATLYRYNPGFNRWATAPDGPHRLALPQAAAERFRAALAEHGTDDMIRWRRHRVADGETLSGIASRYDTTVGAIRRANGLDGHVIRAGSHLVVPSASRPDAAYTLSASNRRAAAQASGPGGRQRVTHEVRSGDTLWGVARRHGVEVRRLASWNGMAPGDPLHPGDRLVVWVEGEGVARGGPANRHQRVTYTVRQGDSLYAIARRFNLDVADIRRWNGLEGGAYLQPGQRLRLRVDVTAQAEAG